MEMLIAICDPNPKQVEILSGYINNWFNRNRRSKIIHTYANLHELVLHASYYGEPDIIFYFMSDTVKRISSSLLLLRKVCSSSEIIISSKNEQYAVSGYRINATWFLQVPYNSIEVREALELCIDNLKNKYAEKFCFNSDGEIIALKYKDIEYFESIKHYVFAITNDGSYKFRENIGLLSSNLPITLFLRCHKCYIVNLSHINRVDSTTVYLFSGKEIPLSRNYKEAICCAFKLYSRTHIIHDEE